MGDRVLDGTAVFTARNIIGELDSVISSNASLGESVQTLDEKVTEMMSSTGLVMKLVSLDEYRAMESYSATTIYLCYEDEATKRVTRIFVGEDRVYAAGVKVTYQIDTGYSLEAIISEGKVQFMESLTLSAPYMVRVAIPDLNIRRGPGKSYPKTGKFTGVGVFNIVEEKDGWGLLKAYAEKRNGWISLAFTTRI